MRKKSQMAIFFLVGLVVLASFGIIYLATSNVRKASPKTATGGEGSSLQSYVQSCLDLTSKNAVWLAGRYGGYVYPTYPPVMQTDYGTFVYDYEYDDTPDIPSSSLVYLPSLNEIEQQISAYVSNEMIDCVNFRQFRQQGYAVSSGFPIARATIAENNVVVELNYPIEMSRGTEKIRIENFKTTVNVRLKDVYNRTEEIINAVGISDAEGDTALIGEVGQKLYNEPKFSLNFLFYIPETTVRTSTDFPFYINPDTQLRNVPVTYSFMPDHLSTLWVVKDIQAKPEYWFVFATKHRQVID